jgi:hypothetical protein
MPRKGHDSQTKKGPKYFDLIECQLINSVSIVGPITYIKLNSLNNVHMEVMCKLHISLPTL